MRTLEIGRQTGLQHVYTANIPEGEGENTLCQSCQRVMIKRSGFRVTEIRPADGACLDCGGSAAGV